MPFAIREQNTIATELTGIWKSPTKEEALTQLVAFKGKYQKQYPEAVRSLMEHARASLDILCLSASHASLHSHDQCD
jgi:transposase-like protein